MTYAAVAMVERLCASGGTGLLYSVLGRDVTKHHALVSPPKRPSRYWTTTPPPRSHARMRAPALDQDRHRGAAAVETATILLLRDERVLVTASSSFARRRIARVAARVGPDDTHSLTTIAARRRRRRGTVVDGADGIPCWRAA
ncbi:hypothetical protein AB5I41_08810 [Sphingomonas sp. MMS24-JH45]